MDFLKGKVNYQADYEEVRNEIGGTVLYKKLFKTPDFLRFIKTEVIILTYLPEHLPLWACVASFSPFVLIAESPL